MITELRDELINFLRDLPEIKKATRYSGELEQEGEWNPVMPAAFVNFTVIRAAVVLANATIGKRRYAADVYVIDRIDAGAVTETVANELDQADITNGDEYWKIKIVEISLIGYLKAAEVWRLKIELI